MTDGFGVGEALAGGLGLAEVVGLGSVVGDGGAVGSGVAWAVALGEAGEVAIGLAGGLSPGLAVGVGGAARQAATSKASSGAWRRDAKRRDGVADIALLIVPLARSEPAAR